METNLTPDLTPIPPPPSSDEPKSIKEIIIAEVLSWTKLIIIVVALAIFINQVVIVNAFIPSASMENNIMTGDRVIAFRLSYLFAEPERFDIIIFPFPDDPQILYVKRVIGMPGETVQIRDGRVYIDDTHEALADYFAKEEAEAGIGGDFGPFLVPSGHYFVLGDNRANSEDSRSWDNPFVNGDSILGRVVFRYYRQIGLVR